MNLATSYEQFCVVQGGEKRSTFCEESNQQTVLGRTKSSGIVNLQRVKRMFKVAKAQSALF